MGITSAIVLFAVIWFMTFLVVLPLGVQTQAEAGEIVPGTHGSSPANAGQGPPDQPLGRRYLGCRCRHDPIGANHRAGP
jgi:hypothetical protein